MSIFGSIMSRSSAKPRRPNHANGASRNDTSASANQSKRVCHVEKF